MKREIKMFYGKSTNNMMWLQGVHVCSGNKHYIIPPNELKEFEVQENSIIDMANVEEKYNADTDSIKCPICRTWFELSDIRFLPLYKSNPNRIICGNCGYEFDRLSAVERHKHIQYITNTNAAKTISNPQTTKDFTGYNPFKVDKEFYGVMKTHNGDSITPNKVETRIGEETYTRTINSFLSFDENYPGNIWEVNKKLFAEEKFSVHCGDNCGIYAFADDGEGNYFIYDMSQPFGIQFWNNKTKQFEIVATTFISFLNKLF